MPDTLKILHVLRAPVGGLFRHVSDLARAQAAAGHAVGVVCCSDTHDSLTEARLEELEASLELGLARFPMARDIGWSDVPATRATTRFARRHGADVLHGHGAKGGAYARLSAGALKRTGQDVIAVYTPHGGSLHYAPGTLKGRAFLAIERALTRSTDGIVFESAFAERTFQNNVAPTAKIAMRVIPNGVAPEEFEPVAPAQDAAEFLFIGELRRLKGVDVLLHALAGIEHQPPARAVIVGDGPDAAEFKAQASRLGLGERITFAGALPARRAFALGRTLVVPSRAESLPYIVLEAAAAGLPLIATNVGGIPEITAGTPQRLVPPGDADALRAAMTAHLADPDAARDGAAHLLNVVAARFTIERMSADITAFYRELSSR